VEVDDVRVLGLRHVGQEVQQGRLSILGLCVAQLCAEEGIYGLLYIKSTFQGIWVAQLFKVGSSGLISLQRWVFVLPG